MPKVPMIDAVWARQVHDLLAEAGRPAASILRQAGIEQARTEAPGGRIPFTRYAALLEAAAKDLADDLFALRFAVTRDMRDTGLIGYIALNSATYADAVRNLERYLRIFNEGIHLHGSIEEKTLVLTITPLDSCVYGSHQIQDFSVAALLTVSRSSTHRNLVPMWVELHHGPPGDRAAAERLLGAPIHYGRTRLAIVAPRSWLNLPIEHADNRLLDVLEGYCREILAQRGEIDEFHVKLERWLIQRLPSGSFQAAEAARDLGMSPRTLARRVRERGTNFDALTNDLRRRLALRYLDDKDLRLSQIAYLLGYSQPSAFNHAFRRWTGRTPNAHRANATLSGPERGEAADPYSPDG